MIAGIGVILAYLVLSVKPLNFVKPGKPVCDNNYCGEFEPLRFKPKSQNALEKQRLQALNKQKQLQKKIKRKVSDSNSQKKKKKQELEKRKQKNRKEKKNVL